MNTEVHAKITVVKRNGTSGSQYPITSSTCMFGKDSDCEIRIQLPSVSNQECKLEKNEKGLFALKMINPSGDVLVNNQTIKSRKSINHNDILSIGGRSFKFEYPPNVMYNSKLSCIQRKKNSQLRAIQAQQSSRLKRVSFGPQLSPEQFASFLPPDTPVKKGAIPLNNLDDDEENAENSDPNSTPQITQSSSKRKSRGGSLGRMLTPLPTKLTAKTLLNDTVPIEESVNRVVCESLAAVSPLLKEQDGENGDMKMGKQSRKKRKRSSVKATTPQLPSVGFSPSSIALDDTLPIESVEDKILEENDTSSTATSPVFEANGQSQGSLKKERKSLGNQIESSGSQTITLQQIPVARSPTEESVSVPQSLDESYLENNISYSSFSNTTTPVQVAEETELKDNRTTSRSSHRRRSKKRTSPQISSSPSVSNALNDTIPMESLENVKDDESTPTAPLQAVPKSSSKKKQKTSARKRRRTRSIGKPLWSEIVKNAATKKIPLLKSHQLVQSIQHFHAQKEFEESYATPNKKPYHHVFSPATIYIGRAKKLRKSDVCEDLDYPEDISLGIGKFDENYEGSMVSYQEESVSETSFGVSESHSRIKNKPVEDNFGTNTLKSHYESVEEHFGTKRLLKTPKDKKRASVVENHFGTKRLLRTPKEKHEHGEVTENLGTKRLMKTPKVKNKNKPVEKNLGINRLMKTPKGAKNKQVEEHFGTKRLLKTPRERKNEPVEKNFGTKRLMKTPKAKKNEAVENQFGIKRLLTTPKEKVKNQPVMNHFGIKRLLTSPKEKIKNTPVDSHLGLTRLMAKAKYKEDSQMIEDEFGLEELFKSPVMECKDAPTKLSSPKAKTRSGKRNRVEMKEDDVEKDSSSVVTSKPPKTRKIAKQKVEKRVHFLSPVKTQKIEIIESKTRWGRANKAGSYSTKVDRSLHVHPESSSSVKSTGRSTISKSREKNVDKTNKSDGNAARGNVQRLPDAPNSIKTARITRSRRSKVEKSTVNNETNEVLNLTSRNQNEESELSRDGCYEMPLTRKGSKASKKGKRALQEKVIHENDKLISTGRSTRYGTSGDAEIEPKPLVKTRSKRCMMEVIKENSNKKPRKNADVNHVKLDSSPNHTAKKKREKPIPDVAPVRRSSRIAKHV